jgi:hypothetical protein
MNKIALIVLFALASFLCYSQKVILKGTVKDAVSLQPILNATVGIEAATVKHFTDVQGAFLFTRGLPYGEQVLIVSKTGYIAKRFPIVIVESAVVDMDGIVLERDASQSQDLYTITLTDDQLEADDSGAANISGVLASSLDVFQRTAAFEFSASFFRLRGLQTNNASVLINGVPMQKVFNGRPQWSNWGGLNTVTRQQELISGLAPSSHGFGGVLGTTNINVRASQIRYGGTASYASSNRSYTNRFMATYASGLRPSNWAYAIALGRRWGNQGFQDATIYDANSIFFSVEKYINQTHSLNVTGIYAPNRRGKTSPNTQEVVALKGTTYNAYWGYQNGKQRNSRIKKVEAPILMLNYKGDLSSKTTLRTNVSYQSGIQSNSRLDTNGTDLINGVAIGGGRNPSPTYYQNLPSYFERNFPNDLEFAFLAQKAFQANGQLNWEALYDANISNTQQGGNAIYALYEDRVDETQIIANSILNTALTNHLLLDTGMTVQHITSQNYAAVLDLLGAEQYLDIDRFAESSNAAQNDLQQPNRLVYEGDRFKYNYKLGTTIANGFAQLQFRYSKIEAFLAADFTSTQYQREGVYQNGAFPQNSLGKGPMLNFTGYAAKGGFTYKFSGKHLLTMHSGYVLRAPTLQNTYSNVREHHNVVPNITEEKLWSSSMSYTFRSPKFNAKVTGYHTKVEDANEISFFFADGVGGDNVAFVQELLQGVDRLHVGGELGLEAQLTPTFKLKSVVALGQFTYANNPNLFLTTEANQDAAEAGFVNGFQDFGEAQLKNYKVAAGPHRAYALGFEYRDPEYWWVGLTANVFSHTYVAISPLTRSSNFTTDFDGSPFNDFDETLARTLLKQERFKAYTVVNLVGGKSWKLGKQYLSLFVSVNNVLDTVYRTGGFEQGRNANFRTLRDDKALNIPVFGAKYWYGRGTTYFLNMNYRF